MENKESRSNYQMERRERLGLKQFNTSIPNESLEKLEVILNRSGTTKKDWICNHIEHDFKKYK